jgi:hypothetical protein
MGWLVFPLHSMRDGRCSCGGRAGCSPGKHPRTPNGFKDGTADPEKIRRWWGAWPDANVGLATGAGSGVVVLDVDPRNDGHESLIKAKAEYGFMVGGTLCAKTGGGGNHYYFQHPGIHVQCRNEVAGFSGLDFKGDGGYVVVPHSNHKSGGSYGWANGPPADGRLAPLPDGLARLVMTPGPNERPKSQRPRTKPKDGSDDFSRVKAAVDIVSYVEAMTGQSGRWSGGEAAFLCPFHEEKTPSFKVNPTKNGGVFICHGCQASGDVFHFHEMMRGATRGEALKAVAEYAGVELAPRKRQSIPALDMPVGHPAAAPGPEAERPKHSSGHPNEPRPPARQILVEWLLGDNGPRFAWRREDRAYSERRKREYTIPQFRRCYDEAILEELVRRARGVTAKQAAETNVFKRQKTGKSLWDMWIDPALQDVYDGLPQKGELFGTTATEAAALTALVKTALLTAVVVVDPQSRLPERVSLFDLACAGDVGPVWRRAGSHQAWVKHGPRMAIRYGYLAARISRFTEWDSRALAKALRKAGIIEHGSVESGRVRAWIVNEGWLARNMDQEIEADTEAEPAAASGTAGAEDGNGEVPF